MADVLPLDASCEDIDIDEKLKFLDGFVRNALNNGAVPYSPPTSLDDDDDDSRSNTTSTVKFTPYERPSLPVAPPAISIINPTVTANTGGGSTPTAISVGGSVTTGSNGIQLLNNKGISQVWGKKMAIPESSNETTNAVPATSSSVVPPASTAASPFGIGSVFNSGTSSSTTTSSSSTTTTSSSSTPVSTEPIKPRELSEKEKMAAALFGGLNNNKNNIGITKRRSSGGATIANPSPNNNNNDDLFGGMTTSSSSSTATVSTSSSTATTAVVSSNNVNDLFGGMSISTAISPSPEPVDNILDLAFTNDNITPLATNYPEITMVPSNPPPPIPPVAVTSSSNAISDIFADMSNPLPPSLTPSSNNMIPSASPNNITGMSSFDILHTSNNVSVTKPLLLTTNEFGIRWGQCLHEIKLFINNINIRSLELLRHKMPANYGHVESIPSSNEAIFAALAINGSNILIHIKLGLQRGGFDIIIKGASKDIIQNELTFIQSSFM